MLLARKGRVSAGSCLYLFKRASYKVRLLQQSVQAGGTGKELPTLALVRALEASPVWGFPCNGLHRDKANSSCTLMMH